MFNLLILIVDTGILEFELVGKIFFAAFKFKNSENYVLLITVAIGLFDSLLNAVIIGFILSSILFMYQMIMNYHIYLHVYIFQAKTY